MIPPTPSGWGWPSRISCKRHEPSDEEVRRKVEGAPGVRSVILDARGVEDWNSTRPMDDMAAVLKNGTKVVQIEDERTG